MKKSALLAIACIVSVVLLVLAGAFISNVANEKKLADKQQNISQTNNLAEAGLSQGTEELKNVILADLNTAVGVYHNTSFFLDYVNDNIENNSDDGDSLDFLCAPELGLSFVRNGNQAELTFSSANLPQGGMLETLGNYTGIIIIKKQKDANGADLEAYVTDPGNPNVFVFPYEFNIEVNAVASSITKSLSLIGGEFEVTLQRANFARFALFTNHHRAGNTTVWFTGSTSFDGPVHTNERLSFALNPSGYFTDEVIQHLTKARFYNNGSPRLLDDDHNGTRDVPTFNQGFQRGSSLLNLESAITQNDLRIQALGGDSEPGSNGIYLPFTIPEGSTAADCQNNEEGLQCPLKGGVYIRGNSDIALGLGAGGGAQYTITQGPSTKEIVVDYANNLTTVTEGSASTVYSGLPDGVNNEGVIIFDRGSITGLSGTVQKDSQLTISSQEDLIIDGHIRYQEYDTSPSLNAESYTNLLGILSWGGDVRIGTSAPADLDIHGIIMAPHGVFTVDNYRWRSPSGNVNLLGGVITDFYGAFGTFRGANQLSGFGRNFTYDRRMLGAMSPPYYPTATDFIVTAPLLDRSIADMGLLWKSG